MYFSLINHSKENTLWYWLYLKRISFIAKHTSLSHQIVDYNLKKFYYTETYVVQLNQSQWRENLKSKKQISFIVKHTTLFPQRLKPQKSFIKLTPLDVPHMFTTVINIAA